MAYAGQTIENPVSGEKITFIQTSADTDGELLEIELELSRRRRRPRRAHPPRAGGALRGHRGHDVLPHGPEEDRRRPRRGRDRPGRQGARVQERRRRHRQGPRPGPPGAPDGAAVRDHGRARRGRPGGLARLIQPNLLAKLNIAMISLIMALLIAEMGLRLYLPSPRKYYPRPPNIQRVYDASPPGVLPGVEGPARYWTNSQGIRGDELSPEDNYRILTLGGSSTECLVLDQTEAWPQLLQDRLNDTGQYQAWVGNAGQAGRPLVKISCT